MTFKDICSDLHEAIDTLLEQRLTTEMVCSLIEEGYTHTMIARDLGISKITLWHWVDRDPERGKRIRLADVAASAPVEELRRAHKEQRRFQEVKRQALEFHAQWKARRPANGY